MLPFGLSLGQAAFGAQAAGSVFDIFSGFAGARSNAKRAEKMFADVARASQKDATQQLAQLNERETQTVNQSAQIIANVLRSAEMARGSYEASTGAAGVSGNTVAAMERDLGRQRLAQVAVQQYDLANARAVIDQQRQQVATQATNRITQAMNTYQDQTPDIFGSLFQLGTSLLGSYMDTTEVKDGRRRFIK